MRRAEAKSERPSVLFGSTMKLIRAVMALAIMHTWNAGRILDQSSVAAAEETVLAAPVTLCPLQQATGRAPFAWQAGNAIGCLDRHLVCGQMGQLSFQFENNQAADASESRRLINPPRYFDQSKIKKYIYLI